jgi:hypothetical protein
VSVYNNKGNVLQSRGDLFATLSRHEEAEFDEALSRAPDYTNAHLNKAVSLWMWGKATRSFVEVEVTRRRWGAAQAHCARVLALVPQSERAKQLLALIRQDLDSLETDFDQGG